MRNLLLLVSCLLGLRCSDMKSRPETADKWKPILVQATAPGSDAETFQPILLGSKVQLDIYAIAPEGFSRLEAEVITPDLVPLTLPLQGLTRVGDVVASSNPGLELLRFRAEATLPSLAALAAIDPSLAQSPLLRFRYGLVLSDGERSVPVYGDFPAYARADVPGATWNVLGSQIDLPEDESQVPQEFELQASIGNPQGEALKIAWFVSAGELTNRRASTTKWKLPGPGRYTAIMTVRGKQSRSTQLVLRTYEAI